MNLSLFILFIVLTLIATRLVFRFKVSIWQIMLAGACAVLFTGQIKPLTAIQSINLDVMLFLFGVFVIGQAMEQSGYLAHVSYGLFARTKTIDGLLLTILFVIGGLSALLMNDTLAIIGTPVVLHLANKHQLPPKALLLCLAFAVTIGSVVSPIGNPQNLLISLQGGIDNSFVVFFKYLAIPTSINLVIAYLLIRIFYRKDFHSIPLTHFQEPISDKGLADLCKVSLIVLIILILFKVTTIYFNILENFKLTYIALISSLPLLIFSPQRFEVVKKIDWSTLVFFASMFVLMTSVWDSGLIKNILNNNFSDLHSVPAILTVSIFSSQLISNVPLVALYLPFLSESGLVENQLIALAVGSTVAGNLLIMGAASNVIIIQKAESSAGETLGFLEFARIGIPLTLINIWVYWLFI
ncbi:MAG TPA: anion transporter [Nitrospinae bacterium]|nr:anion transporter [Nitrospinota bacterium]